MFKRVFYEWMTAEFTGTWRLLGKQNSAVVTDVPSHSTHRKGYQSKLLAVLSEGGRCNFWVLLDYSAMTGDRQVELAAIFRTIPVLSCFVFEHESIYTTRVLAVFDFYYRT